MIPSPKPIPNIGPMSGDMSIAPMMTGMEFTFKPTDAMMMAKARIHALGPLKVMLLLIAFSAASVSMCSDMLPMDLMLSTIELKNAIN